MARRKDETKDEARAGLVDPFADDPDRPRDQPPQDPAPQDQPPQEPPPEELPPGAGEPLLHGPTPEPGAEGKELGDPAKDMDERYRPGVPDDPEPPRKEGQPRGHKGKEKRGEDPAERGDTPAVARAADPRGRVPRVIDQGERAPAGMDAVRDAIRGKGDAVPRRFKVRAEIPGQAFATDYVLARNVEEAVTCYAQKHGLDRTLRVSQPDGKVELKVNPWTPVVTELFD